MWQALKVKECSCWRVDRERGEREEREERGEREDSKEMGRRAGEAARKSGSSAP